MRYEFSLPIYPVSEANSREHWAKKFKRKTAQQWAVKAALAGKTFVLPAVITFVKVGGRKMDEHDNLPMAFKAMADFLSETLIPELKGGRGDSGHGLTWKYQQWSKKRGQNKHTEIIIEDSNNGP